MKRNHRQLLHALLVSIAIMASLLVIVIPRMPLQWGLIVLLLIVLWIAVPSKKILRACPSCGSLKKQTLKTLPLHVVPYSKVNQESNEMATVQGWKGTLTTITKCENCAMERVNTVTEFIERKQAPSLESAKILITEKLKLQS